MKYVYPAVFKKDKEMLDTWNVEFPDVEGAITCGYSLCEAVAMAEDALAGILCSWENSKAGKSSIPMTNRVVEPTPLEKVVAVPDEYSTVAFATLIKVDTDAYREKLNKTEKAA